MGKSKNLFFHIDCNSNSPDEGTIDPHHRSTALGVEAMLILHAVHHFTYRRSKKSVTKNGKESLEHKVCEIEITQEKTKQNTDKPTGVKALTWA